MRGQRPSANPTVGYTLQDDMAKRDDSFAIRLVCDGGFRSQFEKLIYRTTVRRWASRTKYHPAIDVYRSYVRSGSRYQHGMIQNTA